MTDKEIMDYCEKTNNRLKILRERRGKLPNNEAGNEKWESIKDEILSIAKEVADKLKKPEWKAKDVNIQLAFMDLVMDAIKDEQYYMPKYYSPPFAQCGWRAFSEGARRSLCSVMFCGS